MQGASDMDRTPSIGEINTAIMFGSFTNDQLMSILQAVKYARGRLTKQTIWTTKLGDQVKFAGRSGRTEVGVVIKVAKKFITVRCGMTQWRVPANMLEQA